MRQPAATLLPAIAVVVIGCGWPVAPPVAEPPSGGPPASPTAAAPTGAPPPSISPVPPASEPSPTTADPSLPSPPSVVLRAGGGEVAGSLGSYTWRDASQSTPWLPATGLDPVAVSAGSILTVAVDAPDMGDWIARAAPAADVAGAAVQPLARGTGTARFPAPPPGAWVISVTLRFAELPGDAAYYWHVVVR